MWDVENKATENEAADKLIVMLDTVGLVPTNLQLSTNNILAVCGDREYEESCSPDVKVSFLNHFGLNKNMLENKVEMCQIFNVIGLMFNLYCYCFFCQIWDMTILPTDGSLVKENIVIRSKRDVMNVQWWNGLCGVLAIGAAGQGGLTVWDLQPYLDQLRPSKSKDTRKRQLPTRPAVEQQTVSLMYTSANQTVSKFYCSESSFPMASTKYYLLFGGSQGAELNMLAAGDDKHVSLIVEHNGVISGIIAVSISSI